MEARESSEIQENCRVSRSGAREKRLPGKILFVFSNSFNVVSLLSTMRLVVVVIK